MTPSHGNQTTNLTAHRSPAPPVVPVSLIVSIVLLAAVFGVYANTLHGAFVWDDKTLFIEYADIWQWKNLVQLLTTQDNLFRYNDTGFYRPLVNVTFLVDRSVWGPGPAGHHLTNILFHAIATLAVFGIVRRLTGSLFTGAAAGLFFAVHPIHAEAVAWINGRNNLVSIVFYLIAFYFYLISTEPDKRGFLLISMIAVALSLFSKEYALTFPLIVLLYETAYGRYKKGAETAAKRTLRCWLACGCVFAGYALVRKIVIPVSAGVDFQLESLLSRLLTLPAILLDYLGLLIRPTDLTPYHRMDAVGHALDGRFIFPLLGVAGVAGLWAWSYRLSKDFFFALGWMLLPLLPVLNIVPIPFSAGLVSERHLYLPSAGYCMLLGLCMTALKETRAHPRKKFFPYIPLLLITGLTAIYGFETIKMNRVWSSDLRLWQHAAENNPGDFRIRTNLAIAYAEAGRPVEGLAAAEAAVGLNPHQDTTHFIHAVLLFHTGRLTEALDATEKVLTLNPEHKDARNLLKKIKTAIRKRGNVDEK